MKKPASRRFDVNGAAQFLSEAYGTSVSPRTFARLAIPYRVILRRRIYEERDLATWAEAQFAASPRKIGKTGTTPAAN